VEFVEAGSSDTTLTDDGMDSIVMELKDQISMANEPGVELDTDKLMNSLNTIENRTGKIEKELEDLQ